ncbi:hypothetical protein BMR07_05745, partial [Methylococcaceae bacterium CS1]
EEAETPAPNPAGEITNLTAEEVEKAKNEEDRKRFEEAAKLLEAETKRIAEEEAQRQAEEEEKRKAEEARANDYPELSLTMAKAFFLCKEGAHYTFSYYPEVSGWHIFQTYGPSDTVMEIYHNGESIVNEGKSDGDDGDNYNELQHKYLEAGERYVIQVYLE